jgi:hypothetical protein
VAHPGCSFRRNSALFRIADLLAQQIDPSDRLCDINDRDREETMDSHFPHDAKFNRQENEGEKPSAADKQGRKAMSA